MGIELKQDKLSLTSLIENTKDCDKSLVRLADAMAKNIMASKESKKESSRLFTRPRFSHTVIRP